RIFTLLARHCELNGPKRVSLSPLSVAGRTVKPLSARTRCCAWLLPACPGSCPKPQRRRGSSQFDRRREGAGAHKHLAGLLHHLSRSVKATIGQPAWLGSECREGKAR